MRFVAGLNLKSDVRALEAPDLLRLVDAQFDEIGGIQTRYPYDAVESAIFGGGTIADARRIVANGDERLLFTKTGLYSLNDQESKWVYRGEHLATAVDETAAFQTTEEQIDCDRAEISGTIFYAWTVSLTGGSKSYVAAKDKTTGQVKLSPTALPGNAVRPRLTALAAKVLLFFTDGAGNLLAYSIDPASPATALAGASTTILGAVFNLNYDVVRAGSDALYVARRNPTTSYEIGLVTAALAVTNVTKARACAGPISVAYEASLPGIFVAYNSAAGNIVGDQLTTALADVIVGTAIGSTAFPVRNVTIAWQDDITAVAFWDDNGATFSSVFRNTIDTAGTVGTQTDTNYCTIAAHAFQHDARVYCWYATDQATTSTDTAAATIFTTAVENCYLLYRDDGNIFAKSAFLRAGGRPGAGHITGVSSPETNKYAWCGVEQRKIPTGSVSLPAYAARSPLDIVVEFDTNRARRVARSGGTAYVTGMGMQYDGIGLTEIGFLQFPFGFTLATAAAGSIPAGGYSYKSALRWQNAAGDTERSTTVAVKGIGLSGAQKGSITFDHFDHTLKKSPRANMAIEFYRTSVDPTPDFPYYLVSSSNPSNTTGDNRYVENVPGTTAAAFLDNINNTALLALESHPENGDVLESLAPPPHTIIAATDTRVFIAGVAGDLDRVWYSKQRNTGEVASFHEALTFQVPTAGGRITGIALFNRTPIIFRETAAYIAHGDGLDNTSGGKNFQVERITGDAGAVDHDSIVVTDGGVMFKSKKGWYVTNGQSMRYIGAPVADYDSETVLAATVVETQHQIRVLTASRMLVFDTYASEVLQRPLWSEWSIASGVHACMWNGAHYYLTTTGPRAQLTSYTGVDYGIDLETAWIKLNDLQGYGAVDFFDLLGEYRSACTVRVRLARDYVDTYFQDKTHTPSLTAGAPLQLRHRPSIRQVKALKVRITITQTAAGESVKLNGLAFMLGLQPGLNRNVAQTSKQ